jgi:hypothetical protein
VSGRPEVQPGWDWVDDCRAADSRDGLVAQVVNSSRQVCREGRRFNPDGIGSMTAGLRIPEGLVAQVVERPDRCVGKAGGSTRMGLTAGLRIPEMGL